jgi:transcriptional regulator with XRE-family HTH domain
MKSKHNKPSPEILNRVARNVKRLRIERQMTQEQVARGAGLVKQYISNVERGKVHMCLSSIEAIAQGLGCDAWEVVTSRYDYLEKNKREVESRSGNTESEGSGAGEGNESQ